MTDTTKIFVLVHGAWHGGWCWKRVADLLQKRSHKVFTPTLTGLGERSHLLALPINLSTHIADIVNVIKWEELTNIVLVGHSYGGLVISGVAEQVGSAIASIVFLDAFVPESGQSLLDMGSRAGSEAVAAAIRNGETTLKPFSAAFFKVNEKDQAWVDAMCTPQPIATFGERLLHVAAHKRIGKKTYIRATGYPSAPFDEARAWLQTEPGWTVYEMPCGHDAMIDMPEQLTEILLEAAD